MLLRHPYVRFFNQTKRTCNVGLNLALRYNLGGRDALIIANFIVNKVPIMYTHDRELLFLKEVKWKNWTMKIVDPLSTL